MPRKTVEGETYFKPNFSRLQEGRGLDNSPAQILEVCFPDLSMYEQLASPESTKFVGDVRWVDVPGLTGKIVKVEGKIVRITEFGVQSLHGINSLVAKHYESRVEGFCPLQGHGVMEKSGKVFLSRCSEEWAVRLEGTMTTVQLAGARILVFSDGSIRIVSSEQASGQAHIIQPVITIPGQSHGTRTTSELLLGLNWIGEIVRG